MTWPRSPTEKLLDEMFTGQSAQFLAILETISVSGCRPLEQRSPHPVTELDEDTVTDVYQELFTAGVDLVLRKLEESVEVKDTDLMKLAIQG